MTRGYVSTRRAAQVEQTRAHILGAAAELMRGAGFHRLGLEEVASAAGVTRVTIYNQFGSKLGLLEALLDDLGRRGEAHRMGESTQLPELRAALAGTVRATLRFWASDRPLLRRLLGLTAVDPETRAAIEKREQLRRMAYAALVERFAAADALLGGRSKADTETLLMALTSFAFFDQLQGERERAIDGALAAILELASAVVRLEPPRISTRKTRSRRG